MIAFFALGAFGFFLLLALLIVLLFFCVESDSPGVGTLGVIVFTCITCFCSHFNPLQWLSINWLPALITFAIYCFLGVMWSIKKWKDYIDYKVEKLKAALRQSKEDGNTIRQSIPYGFKSVPRVSQNKSKLACWIAYWPFSAVWWFVDDWFQFLVQSLKGIYRSITMRAYAGLDPSLKEAIDFDDFERDND